MDEELETQIPLRWASTLTQTVAIVPVSRIAQESQELLIRNITMTLSLLETIRPKSITTITIVK